jgi:hypothetical protein
MGEASRLTDTVRDLLESGRRERLNQILEDARRGERSTRARSRASSTGCGPTTPPRSSRSCPPSRPRGEVRGGPGLLEYGEKTAGRLMTPDMAETAPVLYVVDDHDHLVGSLPWRRLITADPTAPVRLLRQEEPVSVTPETDQEEVARLVAKYT